MCFGAGRREIHSTIATLISTGIQSATTYATLGSTPDASKPTIMAREATATLICPSTWRIARACKIMSCRRAARIPESMAQATIAPETQKPNVTIQPPLASNESTIPVGTRANKTIAPAARPSQRCAVFRRCSARVINPRQSGKPSAAAATCTRNEASHSASKRSGSFSITNGGKVPKSKYGKLIQVMNADPTAIVLRNARVPQNEKIRGTPVRRISAAKDLRPCVRAGGTTPGLIEATIDG